MSLSRKKHLVEFTMDKIEGQAGKEKVRKTLVKRAVMAGDHEPYGTRFVYTVGDRNVHLYELPKGEMKQGNMWVKE